MKKKLKKIVIKVGSSLITNYGTGAVKNKWVDDFVNNVYELYKKNIKIVIVSSGAIAIGRKKIKTFKSKLTLQEQQASASIGQIYLVNTYKKSFSKKKIETSQILLTLEDTQKKEKKINARKTIEKLLESRIIPIINENDTVATDEIKFGDNDRLSARVAELINADMLILLSDVAGLYNKNPKKNNDAKIIKEVKKIDKNIIKVSSFSDNYYAKGGMITKILAAKIVTKSGCSMIITDGRKKNSVKKALENHEGTYFHSK